MHDEHSRRTTSDSHLPRGKRVSNQHVYGTVAKHTNVGRLKQPMAVTTPIRNEFFAYDADAVGLRSWIDFRFNDDVFSLGWCITVRKSKRTKRNASVVFDKVLVKCTRLMYELVYRSIVASTSTFTRRASLSTSQSATAPNSPTVRRGSTSSR